MQECIVSKGVEELVIEEKDIQLTGKILKNIVEMKGGQELFLTIFQSDDGKQYRLLVPSNHAVLIESCYFFKGKRCSVGVRIYSSPWEDRYKLLWTLKCNV